MALFVCLSAFSLTFNELKAQSTITFDDQGHSHTDLLGNNYQITNNGKTFNFNNNATSGQPGFEYRTSGGCFFAGNYISINGGDGTQVTVSTTDGSEFDLESFDFVNIFSCIP